MPGVAERTLDVDCFDVIEDLRMDGVGLLQVLTARTLWAPLVGAWPAPVASTAIIIEALQAHWKRNGLPKFAQFDNDVRFQGGHNHPDVIGRVMRLCLALGVSPVFVPPLEMGFQGIIKLQRPMAAEGLGALSSRKHGRTDPPIAALYYRLRAAP